MRLRLSNTREVYHFWANRVQEQGHCGNCSFEGTFAYSYSAVIGKIVHGVQDGRAYLVSSRPYSVTTTQHQSYVRQSIPHGETVYTTSLLLPSYGSEYGEEFYNRVVENYCREIEETYQKSKRARINKARFLESCQRQIENVEAFAEFFGVEVPSFSVEGGTLEEAVEAAKAVTAKYEAQREEARRKREEAERVALAARIEKEKEQLAEWLAGGTGRYYFSSGLAHLRISPSDSGIVETTFGARVRTKDVKRLAPFILKRFEEFAKEEGKTEYAYFPVGDGLRIGEYLIRGIDYHGNLVVGCHRFSREEIERFAKVIGVSSVTVCSEGEECKGDDGK